MRRHLLMVLAGVVVASLVGIAQSGEISSEADYDAAMKEVGATFRALRSDMEARDGEAVLAGTAKLAAELKTPIQIGENFYGPRDLATALTMGACDLVMPDFMRIGGVTGWLKAAAIAAAVILLGLGFTLGQALCAIARNWSFSLSASSSCSFSRRSSVSSSSSGASDIRSSSLMCYGPPFRLRAPANP